MSRRMENSFFLLCTNPFENIVNRPLFPQHMTLYCARVVQQISAIPPVFPLPPSLPPSPPHSPPLKILASPREGRCIPQLYLPKINPPPEATPASPSNSLSRSDAGSILPLQTRSKGHPRSEEGGSESDNPSPDGSPSTHSTDTPTSLNMRFDSDKSPDSNAFKQIASDKRSASEGAEKRIAGKRINNLSNEGILYSTQSDSPPQNGEAVKRLKNEILNGLKKEDTELMEKIQDLANATNEYCEKNQLKPIKTIEHYLLNVAPQYVTGTRPPKFEENEKRKAIEVGLVLKYTIHWELGGVSDEFKSVVKTENRQAFAELCYKYYYNKHSIDDEEKGKFKEKLKEYLQTQYHDCLPDIIIEKLDICRSLNITKDKLFDDHIPSCLKKLSDNALKECIDALPRKMTLREATPYPDRLHNRQNSAGIFPYLYIKAVFFEKNESKWKLLLENSNFLRDEIEPYFKKVSLFIGMINDQTDLDRDAREGTITTSTGQSFGQTKAVAESLWDEIKAISNRLKGTYQSNDAKEAVNALIDAAENEVVQFIELQHVHLRYKDGDKRRVKAWGFSREFSGITDPRLKSIINRRAEALLKQGTTA